MKSSPPSLEACSQQQDRIYRVVTVLWGSRFVSNICCLLWFPAWPQNSYAWQFLMRSVVNTQLSYKLHTPSTTCGEQGKLQRLLVNCCWSLRWFCISVRGDFYELSSITACHKYKITTEYNLTWHRTTENYHIDILGWPEGFVFLSWLICRCTGSCLLDVCSWLANI